MRAVAVAFLVLLAVSAVCAGKSKHHSRRHKLRDDPPAEAAPEGEAAPAAETDLTGLSKDEAEKACQAAAAAGQVAEADGETAGAQEEVGAPAVTGDLPAPYIMLADGKKLPLPAGCAATAQNAVIPEEDKLAPGVGPCKACEGVPPPEPIKEIQVLEWPEGKKQPLVLGKQLLTHNKTKMMLKVLSGEYDKIEEEDRKREEEWKAKQEAAKPTEEEISEEYAALLERAKLSAQDNEIESALRDALDVMGLEMSYKKPKRGELDGTEAPEGALTPDEEAALDVAAEEEAKGE